MGAFMHGWWPVVILVVVLLLFGAPKLPGLAKSIGQSMRIFRGEVKQMKDENGKSAESADAPADTTTSTTVLAEPTTVEPGTPNSGAKPGS
jgi:sec-independent protein translocase protein TatA